MRGWRLPQRCDGSFHSFRMSLCHTGQSSPAPSSVDRSAHRRHSQLYVYFIQI